MSKKKIIIFKNDAGGDLIHSREPIYNIIESNKDNEIILYLSERSEKFSFLFNAENLIIKRLNYHLTFFEKVVLFLYLIKENITEVYILSPKNFYFYLPFIFRNVRFYGICVHDINNYKRPNNFFRKYLYKSVINDRGAIYKRPSTTALQNKLIGNLYKKKYQINFDYKNINENLSNLKNYIYFHLKQQKFDKLGWSTNELNSLFGEFLKYKKQVIFTRDIETNNRNMDFYKIFNVFDFKNNKFINNSSNIILIENAKGADLYSIIKNADKVIAFHGMITSFAWIEEQPVLDLYLCEINKWDDYRKCRNSFYEFKPSYKNYDFIIPKKDFKKTINKMKFFLKK